jgi:hypothetical protein
MIQHLGDGICWCSNGLEHLHEPAIDRLYPDRCQEVSDPEPSMGRRRCVLPAGHAEPHYGNLERPGDGCHFCGVPTPTDGSACPGCWTSLEGMNLADLKGLFSCDCDNAGLSIDPAVPHLPREDDGT